MNSATFPRPRPQGTGHVIYRCGGCGETIKPTDDMVLEHIDGRLVARHAQHEVKQNGSRSTAY